MCFGFNNSKSILNFLVKKINRKITPKIIKNAIGPLVKKPKPAQIKRLKRYLGFGCIQKKKIMPPLQTNSISYQKLLPRKHLKLH